MAADYKARIDEALARARALEAQMSDPEVVKQPGQVQKLAKELGALRPLAEAGARYTELLAQIAGATEMAADDDAEMAAMAEAELESLTERRALLEQELGELLLPKDPNDEKNALLEIRAGTGGDEASLFAGDLFRMYARYAEEKRWKLEILSASESGAGGFKEVIALLSGDRVFSQLKFERGVHRVQRVPATESQGRIHTSTVTVAVMPEAEEVDIEIDPNELRIDVMRAGGPGGQSVNTTDSAVRITHLPTGLVVQCQDEKSQHKNKAKALKVLRARLLEMEQERAEQERASERRSQVGTGERSEKIRTYNFPQSRVTDHRAGVTLHKLDQVMEGDLGELLAEVRKVMTARAEADAAKTTATP
ncbi:MAG: peptide chain release factor 1 [Myxococcota bacterium]|nr:peptide chain release factor 1 [Myxococcales bacterium]